MYAAAHNFDAEYEVEKIVVSSYCRLRPLRHRYSANYSAPSSNWLGRYH